ncbi:Uu.00g142500.m01.CDS01 [Anthostomella pinea]|uniref:Uu.00g142500.m01.CDS01 n=1 Tax=Anthostomella pinea TaxID=933095 RepID=A0AAI8VRA4_9PEZI|nr:Uu.00g142500.m01.CDS01 [Anthostomella pinea]
MSGQLPHGAEGAAALTVIFAAVSWICSAFMIWLTWTHNERISYVACVAYFTLLSTTASFIQQIHVIAFYRDDMIKEFERKTAHPNADNINIANGSVGLDLALFYVQFFCYNVESMFIMFWASELAQSIYGLTEKAATRRILCKVNAGGKVVAVIFPLAIVLALQAPSVQSHLHRFVVLAAVPLFFSLGLGSLLLLAILVRYIHSRRKLRRFSSSDGYSTDPESSQGAGRRARGVRSSWSTRSSSTKGIYDRWLLTRFTIGFVLLTVFQIATVLFQDFSKRNAAEDVSSGTVDLSVARARDTLYLFIPGNTPGIAIFVVFGTTSAFRRHIYRTFIPRRWQRNRATFLLEDGRPASTSPGASPRCSTITAVPSRQASFVKNHRREPGSGSTVCSAASREVEMQTTVAARKESGKGKEAEERLGDVAEIGVGYGDDIPAVARPAAVIAPALVYGRGDPELSDGSRNIVVIYKCGGSWRR